MEGRAMGNKEIVKIAISLIFSFLLICNAFADLTNDIRQFFQFEMRSPDPDNKINIPPIYLSIKGVSEEELLELKDVIYIHIDYHYWYIQNRIATDFDQFNPMKWIDETDEKQYQEYNAESKKYYFPGLEYEFFENSARAKMVSLDFYFSSKVLA